MLAHSFAILSLACLLGGVTAQVPQAIPFARTLDLLVVDSDYDGVWRLADFNQDGDYNDPGEISSFYSDLLGSFAWTTPVSVCSGPDGTVYVGDSASDTIYALRDGNGDGDANDPGEHRVFFDATNVGAVTMQTPSGLTVDLLGRVFVAVTNTSSPAGPDRILRLEDLTADGDANDAGEATDFYTVPNSTSTLGASLPTKVVVAPNGNLYYSEVGTTGAYTKGVWQLADGNFDGDANDPGEATLFWTPPFGTTPFYWGLAVDRVGNFYVTDHSANESVWRGNDVNQNGTIEPGEQTLFYQTTGSTWWDVVLRDDGTVLLCEDQTPDRVTALRDLNNDGDALDAGESSQAYNSTLGVIAVAPRGAAMLRAPGLELSPAVVPIGQSTNVIAQASKPGDLTITVMSLGFGPAFPLAPWGQVEIDVNVFVAIGVGFADAAGLFTVPFAVPNNPAVVGTYAFQALSGDLFRLFLSNAAGMTVTP